MVAASAPRAETKPAAFPAAILDSAFDGGCVEISGGCYSWRQSVRCTYAERRARAFFIRGCRSVQVIAWLFRHRSLEHQRVAAAIVRGAG